MDIKNHIDNAIAMSELFLGLQKGSITWGVKTKKVDGDICVCAYFKYNGSEFINVMAIAEAKNKSDQEFLEEIGYAQETVLNKVPSVISVYGIVNMIESLGSKNLKLVYISDPDFAPSSSPMDMNWMSAN